MASAPKDVANAFVPAYNKAVDGANAQMLGGLFQEASTLSFEGATVSGVQNIVQKLTSLGLPPNPTRRVTAIDAQASCCGNGAILVMVLGEWMSQQYQETFQLVPTGSNQYYVHNCVFRVGANNPFNLPPEAQELTKGFIQHYYQIYDQGENQRSGLSALYSPTSVVDYEGRTGVGPAQIMEILNALPSVQHDLNSIVADVQLVNNLEIVLVMLCGQMSIDGANPLKFAQCFILQKNGASYMIGNQVFRLNYG